MAAVRGDIATRLSHWLRNAIHLIPQQTDGAPCRIIRAKHMETGDKINSVAEVYVDKEPNAENIANQILEAITNDANACGGFQKYSVRAYYGATSDKTEHRGGRLAISLRGEKEDLDEDSFDSEPKNLVGQHSQIMRHNEAFARAMLQGAAESSRILSGIVQQQGASLQQLMNMNIQLHEKLQDSMDRKGQRELEAFKGMASERRKDKVFEKLALLMPYVINKLAGKNVIEKDAGPMGTAIKVFVDSLKKDQLERLMTSGILENEQMAAFISLLDHFAEPTPNAPKQIEGKKEDKKKDKAKDDESNALDCHENLPSLQSHLWRI